MQSFNVLVWFIFFTGIYEDNGDNKSLKIEIFAGNMIKYDKQMWTEEQHLISKIPQYLSLF